MSGTNKEPLIETNSPVPMNAQKPQKSDAPRVFIRSRNKVTYYNDSDSDAGNQPKSKEGKLPEWLVKLANAPQESDNDENAAVVKKMASIDESYLSPLTPMSQHNELLYAKFKHNGFRSKQWDIIRA